MLYANERKKQESERAVSNTFLKRYVRLQIITQGANRSQWVRKMSITWQMELYTRQISIITLGRSAQLSETADARLVSIDHSLLLPPPLLGNIVDSSGRHRHLSILDFEHLEPKVNKT